MATHFKRQDLKSVNQKRFYFQVSKEFTKNLEIFSGNDRLIAGRRAVGDAGHKVFKKGARDIARKYKGPLRGWYKYGYKGKIRIAGTMQKSITFQLNKDKQQINGIFSAKDPVSHLIEYGHRTRRGLIKSGLLKGFRKSGAGSGKLNVPAFPFMRPTIVGRSPEALEMMSKVLKKFVSSGSV